MLSGSGELGLGRSLFETLAQGPVTHMHDVLTQRIGTAEGGASFLCGSADGRMLLQARMSLARGSDGAAAGYVVTLIDAGPQIAALAKRDALLRAVAEGLVSPLARLRAAASDPHAVEREAAVIERAISRVTIGWQRAISGWWPKTDMQSSDLFAYVARRFDDGAPKVTVTGLPVWLHADSHSLALAVEELVRRVSEASGAREVDLGAEGEDEDSAWLDIVWSGDTVDDAIRAQWLAKPLSALGGMTVRDVLAHHAGESIVHQQREGRAWLRLPMTKGVERHVIAKATLPTRPEFYDLSLLEQARDTGTLGRRPLRSLTYVVFDTETTGLQPSAGDQMVQIGGVRVVNARILSGESFDRIINPGCPIPPQSIRFHGITDEMVKDKPPLSVVLPQFKAFCADAVLVAHNAAFDLKFLRLRERACGVAFDNPVLDTMILSSYLDGPDTGHSLDDICERLGIVIEHRHTALGDAMVTAAVLLKQIDMLEARGIHTLDEAVKALDLTMALHQRQQAL
ncbi:MAG: 3'-5' exonuclease [Magnetospirillum sp.]|nr:3'-5' exonuclease [Magnetospirillum sp.]